MRFVFWELAKFSFIHEKQFCYFIFVGWSLLSCQLKCKYFIVFMYNWTILVFLFPSMRQFKLSVSNLIRNRYWREGCWDFDLLEQLNSSPILNYGTLWHKLTTILVIQRYCGNLCYAAELVQNMVQWTLHP